MPEPLSPKSGLGMKVTVLPYFLATFLMMYLNIIILSAMRDQVVELQVDLRLAGGGHLVVLGLDVHAAVDHRLHHLVADVHHLVGGRDGEVAFLVAELVAQVGRLLAAAVPLALDAVEEVVAAVGRLLAAACRRR